MESQEYIVGGVILVFVLGLLSARRPWHGGSVVAEGVFSHTHRRAVSDPKLNSPVETVVAFRDRENFVVPTNLTIEFPAGTLIQIVEQGGRYRTRWVPPRIPQR